MNNMVRITTFFDTDRMPYNEKVIQKIKKIKKRLENICKRSNFTNQQKLAN